MADKRMFAKSIVLSDVFLEMPPTARCLYFTLGMLADDDGFIGNVKAIMRQCNSTDDDLRVLLTKRYLLAFETGIIVIKHWRINNYLRNDRYKETTYIEEKSTLFLDEKGAYTDKEKVGIPSIDKSSKDKNSIDKFSKPTLKQLNDYCKEKKINVNTELFFNYYESNGWYVGKVKMKSWKATLAMWNARDRKNGNQAYQFPNYDNIDFKPTEKELAEAKKAIERRKGA